MTGSERSPTEPALDERARNAAWAHFVLRVVLGVNLAMHGVSRLFSGVGAFAESLVTGFAETPLPAGMVRAFGYALPPIELVIGLAILLGVALRGTLIASGMLMAMLTFGSCLRQDWSAAGSQLVYALVLYVLLLRLHDDRTSIDAWRGR